MISAASAARMSAASRVIAPFPWRSTRATPAQHVPERQRQERADDERQQRAVRAGIAERGDGEAERRGAADERQQERARAACAPAPPCRRSTSGTIGQPARGGHHPAAGAGEELLAGRQVGLADEPSRERPAEAAAERSSREAGEASAERRDERRRPAARRARRAPPSPSCSGWAARGRRRAAPIATSQAKLR